MASVRVQIAMIEDELEQIEIEQKKIEPNLRGFSEFCNVRHMCLHVMATNYSNQYDSKTAGKSVQEVLELVDQADLAHSQDIWNDPYNDYSTSFKVKNPTVEVEGVLLAHLLFCLRQATKLPKSIVDEVDENCCPTGGIELLFVEQRGLTNYVAACLSKVISEGKLDGTLVEIPSDMFLTAFYVIDMYFDRLNKLRLDTRKKLDALNVRHAELESNLETLRDKTSLGSLFDIKRQDIEMIRDQINSNYLSSITGDAKTFDKSIFLSRTSKFGDILNILYQTPKILSHLSGVKE